MIKIEWFEAQKWKRFQSENIS